MKCALPASMMLQHESNVHFNSFICGRTNQNLSSMYRINADLILNSRAFYNPMKERQIDLRGIVSRLDYFAVSSTRGMQIKKMINKDRPIDHTGNRVLVIENLGAMEVRVLCATFQSPNNSVGNRTNLMLSICLTMRLKSFQTSL